MIAIPAVYTRAADVTPSDTASLIPEGAAEGPRALLVVAAGDLAVQFARGGEVTLTAVAANVVLPFGVRLVKATGTTAVVKALF